jgi:hypothetical protein
LYCEKIPLHQYFFHGYMLGESTLQTPFGTFMGLIL